MIAILDTVKFVPLDLLGNASRFLGIIDGITRYAPHK